MEPGAVEPGAVEHGARGDWHPGARGAYHPLPSQSEVSIVASFPVGRLPVMGGPRAATRPYDPRRLSTPGIPRVRQAHRVVLPGAGFHVRPGWVAGGLLVGALLSTGMVAGSTGITAPARAVSEGAVLAARAAAPGLGAPGPGGAQLSFAVSALPSATPAPTSSALLDLSGGGPGTKRRCAGRCSRRWRPAPHRRRPWHRPRRVRPRRPIRRHPPRRRVRRRRPAAATPVPRPPLSRSRRPPPQRRRSRALLPRRSRRPRSSTCITSPGAPHGAISEAR